jgi:hypothetical protein
LHASAWHSQDNVSVPAYMRGTRMFAAAVGISVPFSVRGDVHRLRRICSTRDVHIHVHIRHDNVGRVAVGFGEAPYACTLIQDDCLFQAIATPSASRDLLVVVMGGYASSQSCGLVALCGTSYTLDPCLSWHLMGRASIHSADTKCVEASRCVASCRIMGRVCLSLLSVLLLVAS